MMKKAMLCLLMILSAFLLTACQKQPQPEIKLPEPQAAASPAQPGPETVEQTLTLGLIDFEADKELLRGLIQSYNASGAPVRIEIVNYADGTESYADAVTRRTTELMAGNVPDLLDCSDLSGAQYAGYAKNGILLPLDGMPEEGLLPGVQQPCEVDGKRYSIVGAFTLDPLFGPASRLGASLQTSVEDVLRGAVPDVRFVWGGRDLLGVYCRHAAERFLDYDTGTASFESEAVLDLLTACARIQPSELGPDSIMQQPMRSVSVYRQMQNSWYEQTGDAFRVLSLSADGGVTYQPVLQLGVCAASSVQEAAAQGASRRPSRTLSRSARPSCRHSCSRRSTRRRPISRPPSAKKAASMSARPGRRPSCLTKPSRRTSCTYWSMWTAAPAAIRRS